MDASVSAVLTLAKQFAGDVDSLAARYSDYAYLLRMKTELLVLSTRTSLGFEELVLDLTEEQESLTPTPENSLLLILAYKTAYGILQQEYARRVSAGEIGISWKSGLEEESSIQASKAYQQMMDDVRRAADDLIAIVAAGAFTGGFRAQ